MLYYTIYVKNLNNGTGYIDVGLQDDQLLQDYEHYLDVGLASHKAYPLAGASTGESGSFTINMAEIAAITVTPPQKAGKPGPRKEA